MSIVVVSLVGLAGPAGVPASASSPPSWLHAADNNPTSARWSGGCLPEDRSSLRRENWYFISPSKIGN